MSRQLDNSPTVAVEAAMRVRKPAALRVPSVISGGTRSPTASPTATTSMSRAPVLPKLQRGTVQLIDPGKPTEAKLAVAVASNPAIKSMLQDTGSMLETLPGVVRQLDGRGGQLQLKSYVLLARPLTYDRDRRIFTGSIVVGVAAIGAAQNSHTLTSPITFQVLGNGTATPNPLRLDQTSPPHREIAITMPSAPGGVTIRVASNFHPQGEAIMLPLAPFLQINTGSSTIEGFGLGLTQLNIEAGGLSDAKGRVVSLRSRPEAFLAQSRLVLDENGMVSTQVRSQGAGPVTLIASMAGIPNAETQIRFGLPWLTLSAALVGGLVGALIRLLLGSEPKPGSQHLKSFFASALFGILIFALYAVGVNILPVTSTITVGATLVFAVSALGAFLGTALVKNIVAESND